MREDHLTRSNRDHLTRQHSRESFNAKSDDVFPNTLPRRDSLTSATEDFLVAGKARGLSPRILESYAACAYEFDTFRKRRRADPSVAAVTTAEARAFIADLQSRGTAPAASRSTSQPEGNVRLVRSRRDPCGRPVAPHRSPESSDLSSLHAALPRAMGRTPGASQVCL